MKIYLGADHRGFNLKEELKDWLKSNDYEVEDCGATEVVPNDDYVDYATSVSLQVAVDSHSKGILVCGSGAGMDIVANKTPGVRCSMGLNADQLKAARNDDDINILAIASDFTDIQTAKELIKTFLETPFDPTQNHTRRIEKIKSLEV